MEVVGLAVGVAGLAGLFSTCLDAIEKIDDYKDFDHESQFLATQFEADKLRLRQWGQTVGIVNDIVLPSHHQALDDKDTLFMAKQILSMIKGVCDSVDATGAEKLSKPPGLAASKRRRVKWALGGKAKRTTQIEHLRVLVQHLHNLTPTESSSRSGLNSLPVQNPGTTLGLEPQSSGSMELWALQLKDSLRGIEHNIQQRFEAEARRDVFAWLGRDNPNGLYEECLRRKLDGTCNWILSSSQFSSWNSTTSSNADVNLLWIHGPAGFGKTILCSSLVQHLESDPDQIVAHFFLSSHYNSNHDPYSALKSWIAQIMSVLPAAYDAVREIWGDQDKEVAARTDIISALHDVLGVASIPVLVLDGLDECSWPSAELAPIGKETMTRFIEDLQRALSGTSARLLIVSRDEMRIRSCFQTGFFLREVKIVPSNVEKDIDLFSAHIVNRKLPKKDEATRHDIIQQMSASCHGQFLWLKMQERELQGWKNRQQLEKAIKETPEGLESVYDRSLQSILQLPSRKRNRAVSILRWATFAICPLTIDQLSEALIIDRDASDLAVDQLPNVVDDDYVESEVLDLCASLIEVRPGENPTRPGSWTLDLSHFSVKEFLLSQIALEGNLFKAKPGTQLSIEEQQGVMLAKLCLCYLNYATVWEQNFGTEPQSAQGISQYSQRPFIIYAANYWHLHVPNHDFEDDELLGCMTSLFDARNPPWDTWRNFHVTKGLDNASFKDILDMEPGDPPTDPLYYASKFGPIMLVRFLLQHPEYSPAKTQADAAKALAVACDRNRTAIVQTLCNAGVDIEAALDSWTPLNLASNAGHADIVDILLKRGANAETASKNGWTPIIRASRRGHIEVVRLLLTKVSKAHVNSGSRYDWTALEAACIGGHMAVVECLLQSGAQPNTRSGDGRTAFHAAAQDGNLALFQKLQRYAEEWDIAANNGFKPLDVAAGNGHVEMVKYLLDCGADVRSVGGAEYSALHLATSEGHMAVVRLMVESDANINVANITGTTPLHYASDEGHSQIVAFFASAGADVNRPNDEGWTPLHFATYNGHVKVVKILLSEGSRISSQTLDGETPLHMAAMNGHQDVVSELLANGSAVLLSVQSESGLTALAMACQEGHLEITRLLIKAQQSICKDTSPTLYAKSASSGPVSKKKDAQKKKEQGDLALNETSSTMNTLELANKKGLTPLHHAVRDGHLDVVNLLLEAGANASATANQGWAPLLIAAHRGHLEVVKTLIDIGVDMNAANYHGWTPYLAAAGNDSIGVLDYLRDQGVQTSVRSRSGLTPLHITVRRSSSLKMLAHLIDYHPQLINTTSKKGETPLHLAAAYGRKEAVTLLLSKGAEISPESCDKETPLIKAAGSGHLSTLKVLVQNIPAGSAKDSELGRALSMAAFWGQMGIMVYLVESGVSVASRDLEGHTPLFTASLHGRTEAVGYLLSLGADTTELTDSDGRTASLFASLGVHLDAVKVPIQSSSVVGIIENPDDTPLMLAAARGHEELVRFFLAAGADHIERGILQRTALQEACLIGHASLVRLLLDINITLMDVPDEGGHLPGSQAAFNGRKDVLEVLREFGADIIGAEVRNAMPLGQAAWNGHLVVMKYLLEAGVAVDSMDSHARTPVYRASASGSLIAVEFLVDTAGADISLAEQNGCTPLHGAAHGGHVDVVKFLIEKGANISTTDRVGHSSLHHASRGGYVDVVKLLLRKNADANLAAHDGTTPIHRAAFHGHALTVQVLLDGGANATMVDEEGLSPLHHAAWQGHLEVVRKLVDLCPEGLDNTSKDGSTPLLQATLSDHVEVVKFLHEKGASISIADNEGFTPLSVGACEGATSVVRYLLQEGADASIPDSDGQTPLFVAANNGFVDIVRLLVEAGADMSVTNQCGWTPLFGAVREGFVDIVRLLIDAGADVSIPDSYGATPILWAAYRGLSDIVELLIEAGADATACADGGETPLIQAYRKGHDEVVDLLLERSNITTEELGKLMRLKEAEEYAVSRASPYSISAGIAKATSRWLQSWRS
ncbi:hypothetical protein N3K66_006312 [Trichothecium roseum]|uniref:Uncharacterized protein n=1 Tax=Trichothecium roseum TaxID=47278 RepID=A0ACC0UV02_9HYPO|nr:hypothetical protein N3K66_006312 [Trichothecium roseum]